MILYTDFFSTFANPQQGRSDIVDNEESTTLYLDVPGVDKENLLIDTANSRLYVRTVEGSPRKYNYIFDKVSTKKYDIDNIKASLKNGVLEVVVPIRKEELKEKSRIKIN